MLWRQGDILIQTIEQIPEAAAPKKRAVLAAGDSTGHKHQFKEPNTVRVFALGDRMYVNVVADEADLVHAEHATIVLAKGCYEAWRQREYTETGNQWVAD